MSEPDYVAADEYKAAVFKRTGIKSDELSCPREASHMSPCIAKDGRTAAASGNNGGVCVGCEHGIRDLLSVEKNR